MGSDNSHLSLPMRVTITALLNVLLAWGMSERLSEYFIVTGGWKSFIVIGALLTLLNLFVRPLLQIVTAPLRLFAGLLAMIVVHGGFLQLVHMITLQMDPTIVNLEIGGGILGWIIVATCFGLANWIEHRVFR